MNPLCLLMMLTLFAQTAHEPLVRHVPLPKGGQVADAVVRPSGELWVVFGREKSVFFQKLGADGKWRGEAVPVSSKPGSALIGGERGPRITIGKDDVIHVIWTGTRGHGMGYARSTDGGKSFEPQRNLQDAKTMGEGPTIAADVNGNVMAAWLDGRLGDTPESPLSFALIARRSTDNGETFAASAPVSESVRDRACMCCETTSIVGADGTFNLVHRKAYNNIRDMTLWRWTPTAGKWKRFDISNDGWEFAGCPMSAAALAQTRQKDRVAVAWMSRGAIYFATGGGDSGKFGKPVRVSGDAKHAHFPSVTIAASGDILIAWTADKHLRWKLFDPSGTRERGHGDLPYAVAWKARLIAVGGRFVLLY